MQYAKMILDKVETFLQKTSFHKLKSEKMGTRRYEVLPTAKAKLDQSLKMIQLIAFRTKVHIKKIWKYLGSNGWSEHCFGKC